MNRPALLLSAAALAAGVIAGCGDDEDSSEPATSPATSTAAPATGATTNTAQEPAPAPKPKPKPQGGTPVPPGPGAIALPDVVGSKLSDAQKQLEKLGLAGRAESLSGLRAEIKPDWEVCETSPAAGKRVPKASTVTLISDRPGAC